MIPIESIDDPRIAPYRNLKDRELARLGGRFIAEGEYVVRRLIDSPYAVESVLCVDRKADELSMALADRAPLYVAPQPVLNGIVGYKFHTGALACGRRGAVTTIDQAIHPTKPTLTLVVCPEIANTENLGSIIRICAGFGVDALLLGEHCCDPFYRQSIRVSMGTVFRLPIVQSDDLSRDLRRLGDAGIERVASVLEDGAEPLSQFRRGDRTALLLGNEAQGLSGHWLGHCDRRLTIPMKLGTDSLNVNVAAGVILYELMRDYA